MDHNVTHATFTLERSYRDIVPEQRIVYTSTLSTETDLMTVSLTTVEFAPGEDGGTADQFEALAGELKADG
jgi:uncharacterized protein YndB with AHSA1/START domain